MRHHRAGRLADAEKIYRQILQRQPNHPEALRSWAFWPDSAVTQMQLLN